MIFVIVLIYVDDILIIIHNVLKFEVKKECSNSIKDSDLAN